LIKTLNPYINFKEQRGNCNFLFVLILLLLGFNNLCKCEFANNDTMSLNSRYLLHKKSNIAIFGGFSITNYIDSNGNKAPFDRTRSILFEYSYFFHNRFSININFNHIHTKYFFIPNRNVYNSSIYITYFPKIFLKTRRLAILKNSIGLFIGCGYGVETGDNLRGNIYSRNSSLFIGYVFNVFQNAFLKLKITILDLLSHKRFLHL